jgi:ferrous-iron efflux pump FieF
MATRTAFPLIYGARANRLRRRATYASVAVALLLIAVKFAAWLETGSVALLSSVIDSLLDVVAAVLGQSAFITGSALLLLAEAVRRLFDPAVVANPPLGIVVMVFSIAVTIALVLYQRSVVRRTGSIAIGADELHYRSDVILNLSVIAALVLGALSGVRVLDPLFGAAIGVWIIWSAVGLARLSLTQLMDQELSDDEREKIRGIAQSHPQVTAAHDLRTRLAGPTAFIQLHIEMDGEMSLIRAHEISDEVEAMLRAAYPNAEILIHQDPEGIEEPRSNFPRRVAVP